MMTDRPPAPLQPKNATRGLTVLGIETSCDETAAAVVTADGTILSHRLLSQKDHAIYGGVVPEVAARAHLQHLDHHIRASLADAGLTLDDLDAIAVTAGPGLIGGVLVGVLTAKAMAQVKKIPLVAVNHLEGHALTPRLTNNVPFPYLLLLVSGGHCQLLVVHGVGHYTRLGATIDDAVGEAFDKTAKLMGLGYPGGPAVEKFASQCTNEKAARLRFDLPRPLLGTDSCDFSFSGLKTAVKRTVDSLPAGYIDPRDAADLASAFQQTVTDILCDRTKRAMARYKDLAHPAQPHLVVAGGVAANRFICAALQTLCDKQGFTFAAPPQKLCTDNAAMIAWAGIERARLGLIDPPDFIVRARWPLDPDAPVSQPKSQRV